MLLIKTIAPIIWITIFILYYFKIAQNFFIMLKIDIIMLKIT